MRVVTRMVVLVVVTVAAACGTAGAEEEPERQVEMLVYHLGDQAFQPPASTGYEGANELDGVVYYPSDLARGVHPLIMIEHGSWQTCADRAATEENTAAQATLR